MIEEYLRSIRNPMKKASAKASLILMVRVNGVQTLQPRHTVIEQRIEEGARVSDRKGEIVLMSHDGAWFDARNITKHGLNYAAWLSVRKTPV